MVVANDANTVVTDLAVAAAADHPSSPPNNRVAAAAALESTMSVTTDAESEDLTRDTGYRIPSSGPVRTGPVVPPGENVSVYVNDDDDDDMDNGYDFENEQSYGPVVDQTPHHHPPVPFRRSASLAVQTGGRVVGDPPTDPQQPQQRSHLGNDTVFSAEESVWAEDTLDDSTTITYEAPKNCEHLLSLDPIQNNVVDLTPAMVPKSDDDDDDNGMNRADSGDHHYRHQRGGTTALSIGAIASVGETVDVVRDDDDDDDDDKDANHNFGPVVDITPPEPDTADLSTTTTACLAATATSVPVTMHSDERTVDDGGNTIASMAPNVGDMEADIAEDEAMEETCYGGDSTLGGADTIEVDDDDDDDDAAPGEGWGSEDEDLALSTIDDIPPAETAVPPVIKTTNESPLVDHTPSEMLNTVDDTMVNMMNNPSIVALAMSEDETRTDGVGADDDDAEVYDDENEEQFGPVVDHTPQQTLRAVRTTTTKPTVNPDAMATAVAASGPQVIDADDMMLDITSNYGSTLGDHETDAAAGGADDWGEDDDDDDDDDEQQDDEFDNQEKMAQPISSTVVLPVDQNISLVDHTPSEMESPTKETCDGQSIQAHGSIATNTIDNVDEADSIVDTNVVYGPMVDHLPATPATASMMMITSRSDSVLVQGQGEDAESVDTTVMGGGSRIEYNDEVTYSRLRSNEIGDEQKVADQVVDYIPSRFESRHGDGSTLVAADPSEVLSEVDDLIPEEQNFGPVVDLTPPAANDNAIQIGLGEASMAVVAPPSVAADDLDQDDEGDADTEQAGWHPPAEEEPNPQSGIEEPVITRHVDEQVVDFVPPPNDVVAHSIGDGTREALSEMTVGGAQSLLHVGDPVEDDFGPVVDQLPSVAAGSRASTSTQVSASECRAMERDDNVNGYDDASSINAKTDVVIDQLELINSKHTADSIAALGKSLLSEEEEEEEEEDASKFGPVVDQLPTSRLSLAPSHGGSTVDALATVSEVNSDDEGDAWDDDDVDFDASFGGTVSYGGTFESAGRLESSAVEVPRPIVLTSTPSIETDRSVRFAVQQSEMTDKSFAEADTPPSTPYRRPEGGMVDSDLETCPNIALPMLPSSQYHNTKNEDNNQVRQDEVMNSRPTKVAAGVLQIDTKVTMLLEAEIASLRREKETDMVKLLEQENETASLRELNARLVAELNAQRDAHSVLQEETLSSESKSAALEAEVQTLQTALLATTSPDDYSNEKSPPGTIRALQLAIAEKVDECIKLSNKVEQVESRLRDAETTYAKRLEESAHASTTLKQTISSLNDQVFESNMSLKNSELTRIELERKIQALDSEVNKLRVTSNKVASIQVQHEKDLQQQYMLLDMKSSELRNLEEVIEQLRQEKLHILSDLSQQRSLAEQSELLANELISVAKERDMLENALHDSREAILSLQTIIEERGKERQELDLKREQDKASLVANYEALQTTVLNQQKELSALSSQVESATKENGTLAEKLATMPDTLRSLEAAADQARYDADNERRRADTLANDVTSLNDAMEAGIQKQNELELELSDANAKVNELEHQLKRMDELESKCVALSTEVEHFQAIANKHGIDDEYVNELLQEKTRLLEENEEMLVQFGLIKQQMDHSEENERILHAELNAIRMTSLQQNTTTVEEMTQLRLKCDALQEQIGGIRTERDTLLSQQEMWNQQVSHQNAALQQLEQRCLELNTQLESTLQQLQKSENALSEKELWANSSLNESKLQIQSLQRSLDERTQQVSELDHRVQELMSVVPPDAASHIPAEEHQALQEQIEILNNVLQSTRDRLVEREGDLDQLRRTIRTMTPTLPSTVPLSTHTESASTFASPVIDQAVQLRRSNSIRRQAIAQIERDRDASLKALEQLTASVMTYYPSKE